MRVLYDTNVVLDVFQHRIPHYGASAKALSATLEQQLTGLFPAHAVPTVDYILRKYSNRTTAIEAVAWLLDTLEIVPCDQATLRGTLALDMADFEDAIVAQCAKSASCDYIVTRNATDFQASPVRVVTPTDLLPLLQST